MRLILFIFTYCYAATVSALNLPAPPSIGDVSGTTDVWAYSKTAIVTFAGVILALLFVYFVFSSGGGLLTSLKDARQRGEWGGFFTYLGSMLVVAVIILFLIFFANDQFLKNI